MNRLILKRVNLDQKEFILEQSKENSDVITHLKGVIKIAIRDTVKVSFLGEGLGTVEVVSIEPTIRFKLLGQIEKKDFQELHVLVGVSRPPTMKKIIEHASSLGVTHFHFFKAELSDKSYMQSKVFNKENISQLSRLGLAQSSQSYTLPIVKLYSSLEKALPNIPNQRFLLSLLGHQYFTQHDIKNTEPLALAIGPERGWTTQEEKFLHSQKFQPVKISTHTLRVEIATFSALGQLEMLTNRP